MAAFREPFTGSLALTWINVNGSMVEAGGGTTGTFPAVDATDFVGADHDTGSADMFTEATLAADPNTGDRALGVVTRFTSGVGNQGYVFEVNLQAQTWGFSRHNAGTWSDFLAGPTAVSLTVPVTIRLESIGASHFCYINGSPVATITDTSITTGSRGGLTCYNGASVVEVDNFTTGTAAALPSYELDRGTTANATAATTSSVTLTSPTTIAVGNYLIARVAVDNSGTNGAAPGCTVTDPRSNTWTVLGPALADPGAAAAGATAYLCYVRVVTAYQAADALTFNWGGISTTAKAIVVEEWTNINRVNPVAVSAVTNDSGAAASTTAVAVSITPTTTYQLVYTCLADEGIAGDTITYDADTTSGAWAKLTRTASANATATNNQCVAGQYKVVTAAGAQTWNATITSRDWAAIAVVFAPLPSPPPDPRIRRHAPLLVR